jgi:hypothetical protein
VRPAPTLPVRASGLAVEVVVVVMLAAVAAAVVVAAAAVVAAVAAAVVSETLNSLVDSPARHPHTLGRVGAGIP